MWPMIFELNVGASTDLIVKDEIFTVKLHSVEHFWEPDYWIKGNDTRRTLKSARVAVSVNGVEAILHHRPYEMPFPVGGLRLYVETTQLWAKDCAIIPLDNVEKDVRFSAQLVGQPWGPVGLRFPILNYRWRAASYNNTWSSLVPYNVLYYHRGDDFGAIPDDLEVISVMAGTVVDSPVPVTKGSNVVSIASPDESSERLFRVRYAHMNIENIDPVLVPGMLVKPGQVLGKTGCTWNGWRSQWADPHVHVSFQLDDTIVSPYPFLVEAYLRDYPDSLMAVAGGYHFTQVGDTVTLDATRSIARAASESLDYTWRLHTGELVHEPLAQVTCLDPGQYVEELIVRTASGDEDRDYAEIRVYDDSIPPEELAYGWAYTRPLRSISPGMPVLFWNRLLHTDGPVAIDFGDGSSVVNISEEMTHAYSQKGIYTVSLNGKGTHGEPVCVKMRVVVG